MDKIPAFVAVDLETTGLEFDKDEIIEVALVRFENGEPVDSLDCLVKPASAELRPFIESLTGISRADLESAEDFASLAGKICSFVGDLPLVAHNANFDSKFLKQSMKKVGIAFDNVRVWDSLTLSRIAYQDVPNHRLDTLTQELGIERSRAHRALPDADACGKLFVMAYEKIKGMDPWLLDAFGRIAEGSDWEILFEKKTGELPEAKFAMAGVPSQAGSLPTWKAPRVSEFLKEDGLLSRVVEGFKPRLNQQDYASCVERNMHKGGLCVLEAPTGSGKSLAYLVSAANKAVTGERVVISTATHALQSQLWNKDIPSIMPLYEGNLVPAILKGRDNYLCLRKLSEILSAPETLLAPDERDSFMAILPWAVSTRSGDVGECSSFSHSRNRVLWSKISSSASSCSGEKCPYYSKCPALAAKRRAMAANLLLVNHSLFLADLSLDFALLPSYEHVVFDEAHKLPDASNQCFGRTVSFFGFRNVAKTLLPTKDGQGGLLSEIRSRIPEEDAAARSECDQLTADIAETEKCLHRFFMKIGKKLQKQKAGRGGFVFANGILAEYEADPKSVLDQYEIAKSRAESLFGFVSGNPRMEGLVKDASGRMEELKRFMADFEFLVKAGRGDWVFYLEEPFNPHTLKMHAYPLDSGDVWKSKFYPWVKSATFTSATLAVQGDLMYFSQRMGLVGADQPKRPFLKVFNEPFNSDSRRSVMVARYLPKPSTPEFGDALNETLVQVLSEVEENTMVLFTSISAMMKAQAALAPVFAAKGKLLLCQHVDGALDGLVAMFRKSRGACLLGCQSLWEGVDFPGDALKLLVITKLPFPNPSEPLVAGISADLKAKGENVFKSYYIPEAYMELRQGLGRLLRTENDSGKVLVLDNRVVTEAYGKTFARIWNMKHATANTVDDVKKFVS